MEGLADSGRLHPVQQAFIDEQAAQCGYCTSGMMMAATGLLRDRPAPTEEEVREALDGNLCRCGAHGRIVRSVLKAAGRTSGGPTVVPHPPAGSKLGVSHEALAVADGQIRTADGPTRLSYWTLTQPGMLDRPASVLVASRPPGQWSVAGSSAGRLDFPDKVTGRPRFLHDLVLPGMAYGRVVRPPARTAQLTELADLDLGSEVVLVQDGSFLGVVAEADRAAQLAAGRVSRAARWRTTPSLPDPDDLRTFLLSAPSQEETVVDQRDGDAARTATRTLTAEFSRPFLAHASVAPSCAIARWDDGCVTVWCHSQGIFLLRDAIAAGLALEAGQVTVHYVEGAGVTNQVEGGAVQSASWTLREQVRFDRDRITSAGWDSYPILRFSDTPEVMVRVMDAPGEAEVGAGEVAQGPVAGAIGNAVADAVGVRVRDLPLTRERVAQAIQES